MRIVEETDPESKAHHMREYRFRRNEKVRQQAREEQSRAGWSSCVSRSSALKRLVLLAVYMTDVLLTEYTTDVVLIDLTFGFF